MKIAQAVIHVLHFWRCRKRNPLLDDPEYASLHAMEADFRRRHKPVAHVTRAKQLRVNQLLAGSTAIGRRGQAVRRG